MENPIKEAGEGIEKAANGASKLIETLSKVPRLALICLLLGGIGYERWEKDKVQVEYTADLKQTIITLKEQNQDKGRVIEQNDSLIHQAQTIRDLTKENMQLQSEIDRLIRRR